MAFAALTLWQAAADAENRVTIVGGAEPGGHRYNWTVTNNHSSPIVLAEFPHYHATLFFVPQGWKSEATYMVNVGVEDRPGVCTARAPSAAGGIAPRDSAAFSMQVATKGTMRGRGNVRVRFADDTEAVVANVEIPVPERAGDKYLPLIGLGAIAGIFLLVRWLRGRREPTTTEAVA